ncbi:transposase [Micromonospora sp. NBC_00898]|uniref:transposase n=1 Tax=Micromonospora sp. NBC_00898 TaxID=2975981 RepID=UPI00386D8AEC
MRRHKWRVFRAWQLKEDLREFYQGVHPDVADAYLRRWCTRAARSRIPSMVALARRIRRNFDGIVAAVRLGLSNSRLEGINARIRLIQRRGYGLTNLDSLTAMIHLCLGGITIDLPTDRPRSERSG